MMIATTLFGVVLGLSVPLVLGFFGAVHPAFDSLAHFRAHLAVLIVLAALPLLPTIYWKEGAVALVLAACALVTTGVAGTLLGPNSGNAAADAGGSRATYRLLHLNLLYDNPRHDKVLSLIGRTQPDVIVLNEVSTAWMPIFDTLAAAYPQRLVCPGKSRIGGVAILARRPFDDGGQRACYNGGSLAVARVDFGGQSVDFASLHLTWPWPFHQPHQVEDLQGPLATLGDTAILAGDFNAAGWSAAVAHIAAAGRLTRVPDVGWTWLDARLPLFLRPWIGLGLDHVLTKGSVVARPLRIEADAGSDHLPLLLEFSLRPASPNDAAGTVTASAGNSDRSAGAPL